MKELGYGIASMAGPWGVVLVCLIIAAVSYLLGSISFSIIIVRLIKHVDIRDYGSGNAGGTNVLRNFGVLPALFTLIGDFGKGFISVMLGRHLFQGVSGGVFPTVAADRAGYYGAMLAGLFCVLGHIKPVYFGFRGGKGVITSASIAAFIDWRVFLAAFAVFLIVVLITRTVSAGSVSACCVFPIAMYIFVRDIWLALVSLALGLWIIYSHRANIMRIIRGTESKISFIQNGNDKNRT